MTAVKTIFTTKRPAPEELIGQRVIIHAGKREPGQCERVGGWTTYRADYHRNDPRRIPVRMVHDLAGRVTLPLGAVVGSATLAGCYPMVTNRAGHVEGDFLAFDHGGKDHLTLVQRDRAPERIWTDVSDQRPYDNFTPGRFAWLFEDAQPCEKRCPVCGGSGRTAHMFTVDVFLHGVEDHPCVLCGEGRRAHDCAVCNGCGTCSPIPAKGHSGVWQWHGIAALTIAQPYAQLLVTEAPHV